MKAKWSVLVLFENTATRQSAVDLCDRLMRESWTEGSFDARWLSFSEVSGSKAHEIPKVNLVIVSASPQGELPDEAAAWMKEHLGSCCGQDGAMLGLLGGTSEFESAAKHSQLRALAHEAGMDYLTQLPPELTGPDAASLEDTTFRSRQMTSVLDEILSQKNQPPHLPL